MAFLTSSFRVSTSFWLKFDLLSILLNGWKRTDSSTFPFKWLWICPGTAWKEFCYLCHCQVDFVSVKCKSHTCVANSGFHLTISLVLLLFSFCWRFFWWCTCIEARWAVRFLAIPDLIVSIVCSMFFGSWWYLCIVYLTINCWFNRDCLLFKRST